MVWCSANLVTAHALLFSGKRFFVGLMARRKHPDHAGSAGHPRTPPQSPASPGHQEKRRKHDDTHPRAAAPHKHVNAQTEQSGPAPSDPPPGGPGPTLHHPTPPPATPRRTTHDPAHRHPTAHRPLPPHAARRDPTPPDPAGPQTQAKPTPAQPRLTSPKSKSSLTLFWQDLMPGGRQAYDWRALLVHTSFLP